MIETMPDLYFGTINELQKARFDGYSVVNLSGKYHRLLTHLPEGKEAQSHHNYVMYEEPHFLSFNFIDGPAFYYDYQGKGVERFNHMLDFIRREFLEDRPILITCDQGESRSPTVCMLYEARVTSWPYEIAVAEFKEDYPQWKPKGILDFVKQHWNELL